MPNKFLLFACAILLASCASMPRGSGLQREVLHQTKQAAATGPDTTDAQPTEFAVEPIVRANLDRYASWPAVGGPNLSWLKRVDKANTRIISPGDAIVLTIWNTEDNSLLTTPGQRFTNMPPMQVSADGKIFLPYVGQVKVSGRTPESARAEIEKAYLAVAPSLQVQLATTEGRGNIASVVSGVIHAGPFPLRDSDTTVLDVLAEAGGPLPSIANPQVRLQRGSHTYGTSLNRLVQDADLNTTLQGGDRIFLEEDNRYFLSLGATGTKAQHPFPQDKLSALDALSIVGGLAADRANAQGILILRSYPAKAVRSNGSGPRNIRTIFTLDLTNADGLFSAGEFQILPGDLVYVTESPLIGTRNLFGVIGSIFGLANQAQDVAAN